MHKDGFLQATEVKVQAGSLSKVVKAETFGDFTKAPMPAFYTYTEEVFDLNQDVRRAHPTCALQMQPPCSLIFPRCLSFAQNIDPAIFTVPAGCPQ